MGDSKYNEEVGHLARTRQRRDPLVQGRDVCPEVILDATLGHAARRRHALGSQGARSYAAQLVLQQGGQGRSIHHMLMKNQMGNPSLHVSYWFVD